MSRSLYGEAGDEDSLETIGQPQLTRHSTAIKTTTEFDVRCQGMVTRRDLPDQPEKVCGKLLAEVVGRPYRIRCPRCKYINTSP